MLIKLPNLCIGSYNLPIPFFILWLSAKGNTHHAIEEAVSEAVKRWLTRDSWTYSWNINIKAFLFIFYLRTIPLDNMQLSNGK